MIERNYLYRITCLVHCGTRNGTGFLVQSNLVVTASHTLSQYLLDPTINITVTFSDNDAHTEKLTVIPSSDKWKCSPISILTLPYDIETNLQPLGINDPIEGNLASAFGYLNNETIGMNFDFEINRFVLRNDPNCDFANTVLAPKEERTIDFSGLSGAPVVVDNRIVGILLWQSAQNGTATCIKALTALSFRQMLEEQGVQPSLASLSCVEEQSTTGQYPFNPALMYTNQIDILMSKQFEPIRQQRLNGRYIDSWEQMHEFLLDLPTSVCSSEKKAEFYYAGALWALLDGKTPDADEYLHYAIVENSALDTRTYRAYGLLIDGNTLGARQVLKPINTISVLNTYLNSFASEENAIQQAQATIDGSGLNPDGQTFQLMALFALKARNFTLAYQYISDAKELHLQSPQLAYCESLIYYWDAVCPIYNCNPYIGFVYITRPFYPTKEQSVLLNHAYDLLDTAYKTFQSSSENPQKQQIALGLTLISTLLPGKDPILWLVNLDKLNPYSILFKLNYGIKISEELRQSFLSESVERNEIGLHAFALMKLYIHEENYDSSQKVFYEHRTEIANILQVSEEEAELRLLIDCNNFSEAKKKTAIIELSKESLERYTLIIMLREESTNKKILTNRIVNLAQTTQMSQDYFNADKACHLMQKWKLAEKNAKDWYRITGELCALESHAEALQEQGKYIKALHIINHAEESGDRSERIRQCKLNCLVGLSQFDEAIILSKTFPDAEKNPHLVEFQANIYIMQGQKDRAIRILCDFADDGLFDLQLYQLLVSLVQPDNPDRAFEYAYKLYLHDPENPIIIRFAGIIGLMTGHHELSAKFGPLMQKDTSDGTYLHSASIDETIKIIHQEQEHNQHTEEMYQELCIPLHIAADNFTQPNMGAILYFQWSTDYNLLAHYGAKEPININISESIVLDYTACVSIIQLSLFDQVLSLFDEVWISAKLLPTWLNDINNLKNEQVDVAQREIKLSETLKNITFKVQPRFFDSTIDSDVYHIGDIIELNCAKMNHALIVEETPFGKMAGKKIPEGWYELQISPAELYSALHQLHIVDIPYEENQIRTKVIDRLLIERKLVLNINTMNELLEAGVLKLVFSYFEIYLPEETVLTINSNAELRKQRKKAAEWLEAGYNILANLCRDKKINICPSIIKKKNRDRKNMRYTDLVEDELLASTEHGYHFWCDDRYFTSYNNIGRKRGKEYKVLSTLDILYCLSKKGSLSESGLYQCFDRLLEAKYAFFVPNQDYILNRLNLAEVDSSGRIIETQQLYLIRRSIGLALQEKNGLSQKTLKHTLITELAGYMMILIRTFQDCMLKIWLSDNTQPSKQSKANWLMEFSSEFLCDISLPRNNIRKSVALKQQYMILNGISLSASSKMQSQYFEWLFSYLYISWSHEQNLINDVALSVSEFILSNNLGEAIPSTIPVESWKKYEYYFYVNFLGSLPSRFLKYLLNQPNMGKYKSLFNLPLLENDIQYSILPSEKLSLDGIFSADEDTMEYALLLVSDRPTEYGLLVLNEFSFERLRKVKNKDIRYRISCFLSDLSWYLPVDSQLRAQEYKRYLSILND